MLEELLGRASWPLAFMVAVVALAIAGAAIYSQHEDTLRYNACVTAGGVPGKEMHTDPNASTCTPR